MNIRVSTHLYHPCPCCAQWTRPVPILAFQLFPTSLRAKSCLASEKAGFKSRARLSPPGRPKTSHLRAIYASVSSPVMHLIIGTPRRSKRHERKRASLTWLWPPLPQKVGTQRGVTDSGPPGPPQPPHSPPLPGLRPAPWRRRRHPEAWRAGGEGRPRRGWKPQCGPRGGPARRRPPPPAPGSFRPAPPGAAPPRTYPAGSAPGAPAVLIAERGGQPAPAARQPRPRCCRRNPERALCGRAADAAAGEGRAGGGEGGGAGPGLGLPTGAVGPGHRPPAEVGPALGSDR